MSMHGDSIPMVHGTAWTTQEQRRMAALVCADRAEDAADLRILLSTLGMGEFCRFCGTSAIVRVSLDKGCRQFPDDREQWLCDDHWRNMQPLGKWGILMRLRSES